MIFCIHFLIKACCSTGAKFYIFKNFTNTHGFFLFQYSAKNEKKKLGTEGQKIAKLFLTIVYCKMRFDFEGRRSSESSESSGNMAPFHVNIIVNSAF